MYLKSLVLKGFKSFADRTPLSFKPGISAIVGPNGSGKSNISDAVLWVLGERSAHNLRGQAMEDIIFSGSASRKAVSLAQVDLVLNNSDHTLPVDYDEVVITRKMYRNGESEYLLNNSPARRLDLLDILHDTGLGTGTHSIISQGNLDAVLQSRPEERRALIEEAAGVLKHKQRKLKSEHKLEKMDNHLARVKDVAAEIERQLRPLKRKAKQAEAYKSASDQRNDLNLMLAVDDLRCLQLRWDEVCKDEKILLEDLDRKRLEVDKAEKNVSEAQELLEKRSQDSGELSAKERRGSQILEKLNSAALLLGEKRRSALDRQADFKIDIDAILKKKESYAQAIDELKEQLSKAISEQRTADDTLKKAQDNYDQLDRKWHEALLAVETINDEIRENDKKVSLASDKLSAAREAMSSNLAQIKVLEARKAECADQIKATRKNFESASRKMKAEKESLSSLEEKIDKAQKRLEESLAKRDDMRKTCDEARDELGVLETEIKALTHSLSLQHQDNPAYAWLLENKKLISGDANPLSSVLKIKGNNTDLVEYLLGVDVSSFALSNEASAKGLADAFLKADIKGVISFVVNREAPLNQNKIKAARANKFGEALFDSLDFPETLTGAVGALLGDVVLCDSVDSAFKGHAKDSDGLRFVSKQGCIIWPSGKVQILSQTDAAGEGVLARENKLRDYKRRLSKAQKDFKALSGNQKKADEACDALQEEIFGLKESLAQRKGVFAAAQSDCEKIEETLVKIQAKSKDIEVQITKANETLTDQRPQLTELEKKIDAYKEGHLALKTKLNEANEALVPLRAEHEKKTNELAALKLNAMTLNEHKNYAERIVADRTKEQASIYESVAQTRRLLELKKEAVRRAQDLIDLFENMKEDLTVRVELLQKALNDSAESSTSVHKQASTASSQARQAHSAYDEANEKLTVIRVKKSKLEVQVEDAVEKVVVVCHTPLAEAEKLPKLEDRLQVEEDLAHVERRIKNMGTINPDAAQEYQTLKERYDFLISQLDDMQTARSSLDYVASVIDKRMKDDFSETFRQVNEDFNDIFSLLFPGGNAHLELVEAEDSDNVGIEVIAQPKGKRISKMMLMSGGEKSLTALALLFAVYRFRTTPFYILDEVEAALDDSNLRRLMTYIDSLRETTQLIMITHQRRTMEMADVLFGVTMKEDGVTKVISQDLETALKQTKS